MKVYITFGQAHYHRANGITFDHDSICSIECISHEEGRAKAFELFNGKFHNCYSKEDITTELLSYFPRGIIALERENR